MTEYYYLNNKVDTRVRDMLGSGASGPVKFQSLSTVASQSQTNAEVLASVGKPWNLVSVLSARWSNLQWFREKGLFVATDTMGSTANDVEFVANPGKIPRIMTSTDGIQWTPRYTADNEGVVRVAYSPTKEFFVGVGPKNNVVTSTDGTTWTKQGVASGANLLTVAWVPDIHPGTSEPGRFFIAEYPATIRQSVDGITWTTTTIPGIFWYTAIQQNLFWQPEIQRLFVQAIGGLLYSDDAGATWTKVETKFGLADPFDAWLSGTSSFAYSPTLNLLIVGGTKYDNDNDIESPMLASSEDGLIWTQIPMEFDYGTQPGANVNVRSVIWESTLERMFAVGGTGSGAAASYLWSSADALAVTLYPDVFTEPSEHWSALAYSPQNRCFVCANSATGLPNATFARSDTDVSIMQVKDASDAAPAVAVYPEGSIFNTHASVFSLAAGSVTTGPLLAGSVAIENSLAMNSLYVPTIACKSGALEIILDSDNSEDYQRFTIWKDARETKLLQLNDNSELSLGQNGGSILIDGPDAGIYMASTSSTFQIFNSDLVSQLSVATGLTAVTGNLTVTGDITANAVVETSDRRLKEDLQPIPGALDRMRQLTGYTYRMISDAVDAPRRAGLVAQEVEEVLPEAVVQLAGSEYKGVLYSEVLALVVQGFRELDEEVKSLRAELAALR